MRDTPRVLMVMIAIVPLDSPHGFDTAIEVVSGHGIVRSSMVLKPLLRKKYYVTHCPCCCCRVKNETENVVAKNFKATVNLSFFKRKLTNIRDDICSHLRLRPYLIFDRHQLE